MLPEAAYDGVKTAISCTSLSGGLKMTLGSGLRLGTEAAPLAGRGIDVNADGAGGNDVVVKGAAVIHAGGDGIYMRRDGTGALKLELTGGTVSVAGAGKHGIVAVSSATGDVTITQGGGITTKSGAGIFVSHTGTGGIAVTHDGSIEAVGGSGMYINNEGTGGITVGTGKGSSIAVKGAGQHGIFAFSNAAGGAGGITVTHDGSITTGNGGGIQVYDNGDNGKRDVSVTTGQGSEITAAGANQAGIYAQVLKGTGTGDVTVTHGGSIATEGGTGIYANNQGTGGITVGTGQGSSIAVKGGGTNPHGILALSNAAGGAGDVTVTHGGSITTENGQGIWANTAGTGGITVGTGQGSSITVKGSDRQGILAFSNAAGGAGDITVTHDGSITTEDATGIFVYDNGDDGKRDVSVTTGQGSVITANVKTAGKSWNGIYAKVFKGTSAGEIRVTHGGSITTKNGTVIRAENTGTGGITVGTGKGSRITAKGNNQHGIHASSDAAAGGGDLTVTHDGSITTENGIGIYVYNNDADGKRDISVTTGQGSEITAAGANQRGIYAGLWQATAAGDITVTHNGSMTVEERFGIETYHAGDGGVTVTTGTGSKITVKKGDRHGIIAYKASGAGDIAVTHDGSIDSEGRAGIWAQHKEEGDITVTTGPGSVVTARRAGIVIDHEGAGKFDVAVRGLVTGDSGDSGSGYAGVRVQVRDGDNTVGDGGTIVVGSRAHVRALSGNAVRVDGHAGPVKIILELDEDGLTGYLNGKILNPEQERKKGQETTTAQSDLSFHTRAGMDDDAPLTGLTADDPVKGIIHRRKVLDLVYDEVIKGQFREVSHNGKRVWYEFEDVPPVQRLYRDRARLYEALPSVLLDLNAGPGVGSGMCGGGARAEVSMSEGERMAESSTTSAGWRKQALGWDVKRRVVEAGYDFPADGSLCVGFSAGRRTVKADVMRGGGVKAEATGGAVTLGWRPDSGVDVSWRLSYSRLHDIELSPAGGGAVIAAPGGGGVSVSVAAGKRMEFQGMQVTPRAGFEFSSVETGGFTEPAALEGAGEVSDVRAGSVKGTLGARIDMAAGEAGTLWAAADVEHDFKGRTDITVTGAVLEAEMKPTWGRLGLGGEFRLSDMMTVSGGAYYAAGGGGNKDLGGSLALNVSF